jgi:photosystem II stability/assembly factor-like uncharacterized protein
LPFAAPLSAAIVLVTATALGNGRFPAADQLLIDPSDPMHIVVRTTFGFVESRNGGKEWLWTCEDIIGRIANQDPPFAVTGDGSVVVAVPFEGVSVTHDHGCTWTKAPAPLAGQLAVDVTLEPDDAAGVVVLTSTNDTDWDAGPGAPSEFRNLVVETKDHGVTWSLLGVPLARDFIAATIEIAHSDPKRIYASGVFGDPLKGAVERSEDGGKTWSRAVVPTGSDIGSVYISAVDAQNADRLFVRVLAQADPATMATPTVLLESTDKGNTWREVAKTAEGMLGFALSPDGSKLAYGTLGQGVFVGPSDGSGPLMNVSELPNRCLTWSAAGLYACGTDLGRNVPVNGPSSQTPNTFAVGLSHDMGKSYDTLYKLFQTCPTQCPEDSRYNRVCRMAWEMKPGVTTATGATGETCTVPWAKTAMPEGGSGSGAGGMAGVGGAGGAGGDKDGGGAGGSDSPSGDSCSCRLAAARSGRTSAASFSVILAAVAFLRRPRARRRHSR